MLIQNDILERIDKINWFCNCGNKSDIEIIYPIKYLDNWKKAQKNCLSSKWEEFTLERSNENTQYLHDNYPDKYRQWNKFAKEAREFIQEKLQPRIVLYLENNSLKREIEDSVKWDIIHAIMEQVYAEQKEPGFFMELLKVYEAGHLPCGWNGKWPKGELMIF
ncbi:hypothetical protein [Acetivibrio clariflavus]|uniref:Uncharacterized protein n=1 Tax=Acetivibrio clariflavus (strain DSM 19732 / NBRC 101661 / EBR45) TaxID=720554 RepID=G8LYG1_ACECE|nr:hypothetical protein [Acetivibrio clariflavus]AEV68930.1 hypothetical protein Clocl_2347 [Acetivibrio clariflavus DSM 19732]